MAVCCDHHLDERERCQSVHLLVQLPPAEVLVALVVALSRQVNIGPATD